MSTPCEELSLALCETSPLPDALRAHARACGSCGLLLRAPDALDLEIPMDLTPSLALREALHDAKPARRVSAWRRAAPTVLVVCASLGMSPLLGRVGSSGWALSLALTAVAAAGMVLVFWRAGGLGSPGRLRRWYPVGAAVTAALAASLRGPELPSLRGALGHLPSPGTAVDAVTRPAISQPDDLTATVAVAGLLTVLSATAALLGARRTTPNLPALTGATLGAASALLGLGVAHHGVALPAPTQVMVVMVAAALCAGVGRRMLSP